MALRIGSGSGWWGDRIAPAAASAEHGELDYLCFETMAEATVSAAQVRTQRDPEFPGYDTYLEERFRAVLPHCLAHGTRIISNQGWVNPLGAARAVRKILDDMGRPDRKVAAVTGSLVTDRIRDLGTELLETGGSLDDLRQDIISAEAYQGAGAIVAALESGADVVITGRVADPSLFLAPMMHEFGWAADDLERLGQGAGIGHLLECGAQVTGGYFADPGFKDVPAPWDLAYPIADVESDGSALLWKIPDTGGLIDRRTVLEQMFYEIHDPANYVTPDVVVDFTGARIEDLGGDRVRVSGMNGKPRPQQLKVSMGVREGFIGEDMFFYAGPGVMAKAQLAEQVLRERLRTADLRADELRIDFLGVNAIHGAASPEPVEEPYELAVRVAARAATRAEAEKVGREVDGMGVSGLGSTGKRVPHQDRVREVIGIWSTLIDREAIEPQVHFV